MAAGPQALVIRFASTGLAHVDAYEGVNLVSLCLDQLSICHVLLHLDRQGRKGPALAFLPLRSGPKCCGYSMNSGF